MKRSCFITKFCQNKNRTAGFLPKWLEVIAGTKGTVELMSTFTKSSLQTDSRSACRNYPRETIVFNKQSSGLIFQQAAWECSVGGTGQAGRTNVSSGSVPSCRPFPCSPPWDPTPVSLLHVCPPWAPHHWLCLLHSHISPLQIHVFICLGTAGITVPDVSQKHSSLVALKPAGFGKQQGMGFPSALHSGCSSGRDEGLALGWEAGSSSVPRLGDPPWAPTDVLGTGRCRAAA